jgi:rhamnose utilization protein RhaD (predicted bifunctional aldolase and dehydrogenase)
MVTMDPRAELIKLCRLAADPRLDLVIAGEGNASVATARGTLLVTPSGARLSEVAAADIVEIYPEALCDGLDREDSGWAATVRESSVEPAAPAPTIESGLHAVLAATCHAPVILHTHPTDVLGLLCSGLGPRFATERLCPDHVVLAGRADCFVPYERPGAELARQTRHAVLSFQASYGCAPRVILLGNHGMFALGRSAQAVLDLTLMTTKLARIASAAFAIGETKPLPRAEIEHIDSRDDERYRRVALGVET